MAHSRKEAERQAEIEKAELERLARQISEQEDEAARLAYLNSLSSAKLEQRDRESEACLVGRRD